MTLFAINCKACVQYGSKVVAYVVSVLSSFMMTYHRVWFVTRRLPLAEQEILTPPIFSGIRVVRSFYVV